MMQDQFNLNSVYALCDDLLRRKIQMDVFSGAKWIWCHHCKVKFYLPNKERSRSVVVHALSDFDLLWFRCKYCIFETKSVSAIRKHLLGSEHFLAGGVENYDPCTIKPTLEVINMVRKCFLTFEGKWILWFSWFFFMLMHLSLWMTDGVFFKNRFVIWSTPLAPFRIPKVSHRNAPFLRWIYTRIWVWKWLDGRLEE